MVGYRSPVVMTPGLVAFDFFLQIQQKMEKSFVCCTLVLDTSVIISRRNLRGDPLYSKFPSLVIVCWYLMLRSAQAGQLMITLLM
jgi:hypothetical protein